MSMITLSQRAIDYLTAMQAKHQAQGIVIALKKSGCAGYMYQIEPCQLPSEGAVEVKMAAGLTIYIPRDSVGRIRGSRLDYQKNHLDTKAVFDNPNVQLACGCGDSVELLPEVVEAGHGE